MRIPLLKESASRMLSLLVSFCIALCMLAACGSSDDPTPEPGPGPGPDPTPGLTTVQKVNNFTYDAMHMFYLWNKEIPSSVTGDSKENSFDYFKKMIHADDGWSGLTYTAASRADVDEISTGFGYQLLFVHSLNSEAVFPLVMYVNPDSPASRAGLKRGDVICTVGGKILTESSWKAFANTTSTVSLEIGEFFISEEGKFKLKLLEQDPVTLTASTQYFDTVVHSEIINEDSPGEPQVGYICYTGYTFESEEKLIAVLKDFKAKGVDDVVLDLRYNPGGYAKVSANLASMLAPATVVNSQKLFLKEVWNDEFIKYYTDPNQYFNKKVSVNLDLSRLYVLTTAGTASASEATMVGLMPYMDVVHIGEHTHGKFCGALTFTPEEFYKEYTGKHFPHGNLYGSLSDAKGIPGWEANIMLYQFMNAEDKGPKGGLAPKYEMKEVDGKVAESFILRPFGSKEDPMIAQALSLITTGSPLPVTKTAGTAAGVQVLRIPPSGGGMIVDKKDLPGGFYR